MNPKNQENAATEINMVDRLAIAAVEQLDTLTGKKREDANIAFWCGAASAMHELGHPRTEHVNRVIALVIATRGYAEVKNIADKARQKTSEPQVL